MSLMKIFLALLQDNAKTPALWSLSQVAIYVLLSWTLLPVLTSQFCPHPCPSLYLLSLCEYFKLLLPLVRDAGDWALIVCMQCGCCGMQLPGVWCVVTGVWPLTPAGRLLVCLFGYTWPAVTLPSPHIHLETRVDTHKRIYIAALDMVPKI